YIMRAASSCLGDRVDARIDLHGKALLGPTAILFGRERRIVPQNPFGRRPLVPRSEIGFAGQEDRQDQGEAQDDDDKARAGTLHASFYRLSPSQGDILTHS